MKADFYEVLPLDARQVDIVRRMADGERRGAIAIALRMTLNQISRELEKMRDLLNAHNDAHLVAIVCRAGQIDPVEPECDGQTELPLDGAA